MPYGPPPEGGPPRREETTLTDQGPALPGPALPYDGPPGGIGVSRLTVYDWPAAAALPEDGTEEELAAAARGRRDLALEGYARLREATGAGDPEPLAAFHRAAGALVRDRTGAWRERWRAGAAAASAATGEQLDLLAGGVTGYLAGAVVRAERPLPGRRFGMCGHLETYASAH